MVDPNFANPASAPMNYSIAGIGDCLAPLFPEGATYSMSQTESVAVGDLVAVFFAEGVFTVGGNFRCKVLTGQTPETITLMQLNPLQSLTFKREFILAMHRVVAVHLPLRRSAIDPRALLAPHLRPSSPVKRITSMPLGASLHCGFNGVDGATTTTDESSAPHALTFVGNAQIDTAQFKFGVSSLLLDGTGDRVSSADSLDWQLGASNSDPWTVEAWVRWNVLDTNNRGIIGQNVTGGWTLTATATGQLGFASANTGTITTTGTAMTTGVWYHVAVDHDATGKVRLYIDGVMRGSATPANSAIPNDGNPLAIGAQNDGGIVDMNGWLDEVRITKGVARYATDTSFTVPTSAFPRF